jgi:hypothetical protein
VLIACVLIGCIQTRHVTLVAESDPDADACFNACKGSASCARACPGVSVEDGDCQGRSGRTCISGGEVNGARTTATVVVLGSLAMVGLEYLILSALTPSFAVAR